MRSPNVEAWENAGKLPFSSHCVKRSLSGIMKYTIQPNSHAETADMTYRMYIRLTNRAPGPRNTTALQRGLPASKETSGSNELHVAIDFSILVVVRESYTNFIKVHRRDLPKWPLAYRTTKPPGHPCSTTSEHHQIMRLAVAQASVSGMTTFQPSRLSHQPNIAVVPPTTAHWVRTAII